MPIIAPPKDQVVKKFTVLCEQAGTALSMDAFRKLHYREFGVTTILNQFGTWRNLIDSCDLSSSAPYYYDNLSLEDIKQKFLDYVHKVGYTPTADQACQLIRDMGFPSSMAKSLCGSWPNFVKHCGLPVNKRFIIKGPEDMKQRLLNLVSEIGYVPSYKEISVFKKKLCFSTGPIVHHSP